MKAQRHSSSQLTSARPSQTGCEGLGFAHESVSISTSSHLHLCHMLHNQPPAVPATPPSPHAIAMGPDFNADPYLTVALALPCQGR